MKPSLRNLLMAFLALLAAFAPLDALARHPRTSVGQVVVTNHSGADITVEVVGQRSQLLRAWQTAALTAPFGDATVRATYIQLGASRILQTDRVRVSPYHQAPYVLLRPETRTRILVTNATRTTNDLTVNGRFSSRLEPGASTVVGVAVGSTSLVMSNSRGVVSATTIKARAFGEDRWLVEDPRAQLAVRNPLPIPIEVVCEKGLVRTIPAGGTVVYEDLSPGAFRLVARRTSDELIDESVTQLRPGSRAEWRVDAPTTGIVLVDSDHWLATRLLVDGRSVDGLTPNAATRLVVGLGWHRFQARDEQGRTVADTWIEVKPYDNARVQFGSDRPYVADNEDRWDDHHDRRHDRDGRRHDRDDDDRRDRDHDDPDHDPRDRDDDHEHGSSCSHDD